VISEDDEKIHGQDARATWGDDDDDDDDDDDATEVPRSPDYRVSMRANVRVAEGATHCT